MANTEQYREHIECTFNAFYKIVLYHAALEAYKKLRKKQQFEISLDYLHEFNFEPVTTTDEHFVKYDEPIAFIVRGKTVIVESDTLVSTEQIPIFAAAIKSAKSAQTGAKGYAGFYADSTLQSTWQA